MAGLRDTFGAVFIVGSIIWATQAVLFPSLPLHLFGTNVTLSSLAHTTTIVLAPAPSWQLILFVIFLIATLEYEYFPTTAIVVGYFGLMIVHGIILIPRSTLGVVGLIAGTPVYFIIGAFWLRAKWWSYLHDPKNENIVSNIKDGREREFFIGRIRYLYPHFLYWPLSALHTILTKLVYQLFEYGARHFSGSFGKMVETRKAELVNTKTPPAQRKNT